MDVKSVMEEVRNLRKFVRHAKELNQTVLNQIVATVPIAVAFQVFLGAAASAVEISATLASVTGGVLRNTTMDLLGIGVYSMIVEVSLDMLSVMYMVTRYVV